MPGTGDTTPLGTGKDRAAGIGRQGGGVIRELAEEGYKLEGSTHSGQKGR